MDVLLENMPQMVPSEKSVRDWFDFGDQRLSLVEDICEGEQVTLTMACDEVFRTLLSSLDSTSTMLQAALLSVFEGQATGPFLDVTNIRETSATIHRVRWLATTLARWSTQIETSSEGLLRRERSLLGRPEQVERQLWPIFLQNRAKLNAFYTGSPGEEYLETRKILLPQGATLILHHWQRELNDFVNDLEEVSVEPARTSLQKAPSFRLYNAPLKARSKIGKYGIAGHAIGPAPMFQGHEASMQRESVPALATFLSLMLDEGVESPDAWFTTYVCYTSMLTSTERQEGLKCTLWFPSRL